MNSIKYMFLNCQHLLALLYNSIELKKKNDSFVKQDVELQESEQREQSGAGAAVYRQHFAWIY